MGLTKKNFHEKTWLEYHNLKKYFGSKTFHIYNIVGSQTPADRITQLTSMLQEFKWKGLLIVLNQKARVRVRGKTRWINRYQFV